jgi:hypothetical protein
MAKWESDWTELHSPKFNDKPIGDEVKIVTQVYQSWLPTANRLLK